MRKTFVLLGILLVVGLAAVGSARDGTAAFHLMRVYGVLGGAGGDANIQYVELRMTDPGQSVVNNTHICFFDSTGAAYARFRFTSNVSNAADEASILVGSAEFDTAWAAGSPNFTFSAANTVAIQGGADILHPIRTTGGKVAFGTDGQATPSLMCQASFTPIDSVAYGTGYSGSVNFGTKLNSDLTTSGTNAVRLQGPICFQAGSGTGTPCANPRDNSVDYAITDVNTTGNNPRNNSSQSGPISPPPPDTDGDGVVDASDLCPSTAPAAPVDANGCSQAQVDIDGDGDCDPGAPSGGPGPCTGTDNCPRWANPAQNVPPWSVPMTDPDCDGFTNAAEIALSIDPNDPCANTPAGNDETDDKWPADFSDNGIVNTLDLTVYGTALNTLNGNPNYVARADLNSNNVINTIDLIPYAQMLGQFCNS